MVPLSLLNTDNLVITLLAVRHLKNTICFSVDNIFLFFFSPRIFFRVARNS